MWYDKVAKQVRLIILCFTSCFIRLNFHVWTDGWLLDLAQAPGHQRWKWPVRSDYHLYISSPLSHFLRQFMHYVGHNCREFRLIERTTKDGLHWSATAPVRRNISMLELAKTQCTGLSGSVTDNTTTLGRCVLGGKTSNSLAMPGFNLTVFESWRASFGANDNTFTVTPNGTIIIWLSFSNDFDIMQSNGRTYWTVRDP